MYTVSGRYMKDSNDLAAGKESPFHCNRSHHNTEQQVFQSGQILNPSSFLLLIASVPPKPWAMNGCSDPLEA
jgi:hypothetical protein